MTLLVTQQLCKGMALWHLCSIVAQLLVTNIYNRKTETLVKFLVLLLRQLSSKPLVRGALSKELRLIHVCANWNL